MMQIQHENEYWHGIKPLILIIIATAMTKIYVKCSIFYSRLYSTIFQIRQVSLLQ